MEHSSRENTCVVCFRHISIYAVGDCDHYDRICYICSTRLRVLCNKYECPICRKDIPKVIFSKHRQPYGALSRISYPVDHKYKIAFADDEVRENYEMLLEHACTVCQTKRVFQSFGHLKDHLRKEHQLFFCELCVENLKLFTHERRFYNRKELGSHRRVGDVDDKSHKGHPSCQFCEKRYMDGDDLFRHLRKDHFFCHFCDSNGMNFFYSDYEFLQDHFRDEHFLCEEGSCKEEKFTGAFRSQIDLKAHKASEHCKNMNKQQAKQARTLELEFTYRSRPNHPNGDYFDPNSRRGRKGGPPKPSRNHRENEEEVDQEEAYAMFSKYMQGATAAPYTHCQNEFPQLGDTVDGAARPEGGKISVSVAPVKKFSRAFNANSEEDFPVLSGVPSSSASGNMASARVTLSSPQQTRSANSVLFKINNKDKGGGPGNISIQVSSKTKPVMTKDNFPSLPTQMQKVTVPLSTSVTTTVTSTVTAAAPRKSEQNDISNKTNNNSNSSSETNGWKTVKGHNKPSFEEEYPKLVGKSKSGQEKRVSSLTIPVGSSSWTKSSETKETPSLKTEPPLPKEEAPFVVAKGKNSKKSDKKMQNVQESKSKSKDSSDKKGAAKTSDKVVAKSSSSSVDVTSKISPEKDSNLAKVVGDITKNNETSNIKSVKNEMSKVNVDVTSRISPEKDTNLAKVVGDKTKNNIETSSVKSVKNGISKVNDDDFPPLVVQRKTPPGFTSKTSTNSNHPPPGFLPSSQNPLNLGNDVTVMTLSSVARQFSNPDPTSSALDPNSLPLVPKLIRAKYLEPSNFEDRNRTLIQKIRELLDGDEDAFMTFKQLSGQFRQSMVQAQEYYEKCIVIFGKEKFQKIFPELLVLLPDIGKEQELLNVYNQVSKKDKQNYGAVPKSSLLHTQVLVCATCQQVLAAKDFQNHMFCHNEDTLFPPLSGCNNNNSGSTHITWLKK